MLADTTALMSLRWCEKVWTRIVPDETESERERQTTLLPLLYMIAHKGIIASETVWQVSDGMGFTNLRKWKHAYKLMGLQGNEMIDGEMIGGIRVDR